MVSFRWAVDKQLRGAVIDFAGDSHHANAWAAHLYPAPAATIIPTPFASSPAPGLHVIWRCWQDRVPYDPGKHRALQAVLNQAA